jgi:hypothetical protein
MRIQCRTAQRAEVLDADPNAVARTPPRSDIHPELATGYQSIWLQQFQKKIFFFGLGHPVYT